MSAENKKTNHPNPLMESIRLRQEANWLRGQIKFAREALREATNQSEAERFQREKDRRKRALSDFRVVKIKAW